MLEAALEGLDALDKEYPDHPDLHYTRATVLETGGRTQRCDRAVRSVH